MSLPSAILYTLIVWKFISPTSAGKTFISFHAMERVLRDSDDGVVIYVAPTKALVNQVAAEVFARFRKDVPGKSMWAIHTRDCTFSSCLSCRGKELTASASRPNQQSPELSNSRYRSSRPFDYVALPCSCSSLDSSNQACHSRRDSLHFRRRGRCDLGVSVVR